MLGAQARGTLTCVVFDEFQDILKLEGANALLGTMRGRIQFQKDIAYVFLGSVRNQMTELFANPRSAFYKSAALLEVGRIDDAPFIEFLRGRFRAGNRHVEDDVLLRILDITDRVSGDVQELCDALWTTTEDGSRVSVDNLPEALELVFARESKAYFPLIPQLTGIQLRIFKGVAAFGGCRTLSAEFRSRVKVIGDSSVKKALQRMVSLDILYLYGGEYRFCNPFFKEWLMLHAG